MPIVSDIAHAMKWIKTEIEVFGGDPNRFTLMGHSGGGALVKLVVSGTNIILSYRSFSYLCLQKPKI